MTTVGTAVAVTKLTARVGAVVEGVTLGPDISDAHVELLLDLLAEHGVLFFRNQPMDSAAQIGLTDRLGGASAFPLARLLPGPPRLVGSVRDTPSSPPDADGWHTDITWVQDPPAVAVLQAVEIPSYGGDTLWVSLEGVYDRLSRPMQALCESLTAFHSPGERFIAANRRILGDELADRIEAEFPGVHHPLVRTHPRTGRRSLFYSSFLRHVDGLTEDESELLLGHVRQLIADPNLQVRWRWTPGDVAMWDEANTNHRALSDHFHPAPQDRRMERTTVRGEPPFFRP